MSKQNVFIQQQKAVEKVKRNLFDLSFKNNLSMKFGYLYPVMCKEVYPGDSFRIKANFGLRLMPMEFPVQNSIRANLHFFYVRTRTIWDNFPDFIGMNETQTGVTHPHPYLGTSGIQDFGTGSLADYMGLPTTVVSTGLGLKNVGVATRSFVLPKRFSSVRTHFPGSYVINTANNSVDSVNIGNVFKSFDVSGFFLNNTIIVSVALSAVQTGVNTGIFNFPASSQYSFEDFTSAAQITHDNYHSYCAFTIKTPITTKLSGVDFRFPNSTCEDSSGIYGVMLFAKPKSECNFDDLDYNSFKFVPKTFAWLPSDMDTNNEVNNATPKTINLDNRVLSNVYSSSPNKHVLSITDNMKNIINKLVEGGAAVLPVFFYAYNSVDKNESKYPTPAVGAAAVSPTYSIGDSCFIGTQVDTALDVRDNGMGNFMLSKMHISSLPFRVYEACFNAFYRNQQVNPFKINGTIEYNKYVTTKADGEDNTHYELYKRDWEKDFLTSCLPSPQAGIAPLVGVVAADGTFTVDSDSGAYNGKLEVGSDGETIVSVHSPDMPLGTKRALVDAIAGGISINDFRNVSALQKFLEKNMRRGFRYKDQILSHFGVEAKFEELDMPEFLGGISRPVEIMTVTQTVDGGSDSPLGAYAGNGGVFAAGEHSINKYFDEHGFVMAILSVQPVPTYNQLLPKMYLHKETLDYMFPEFTHLGLQPVCYDEVCPLQTLMVNPAQSPGTSGNELPLLTDVFGYQRPNYDLVGSVDESHGLMRTSLRNFLMNREFGERPELSPDFVMCDPAQINDVFAYQGDSDKILGQVAFEISAKRPIPRIAIPRLE